MVEAALTQENLGELHGRLSRCFARVEPLQQARKYVTGLMSDLGAAQCVMPHPTEFHAQQKGRRPRRRGITARSS